MITTFKRVFKFAVNDFSRNKGISIASIFVLVVIIMFLTGLWFFHGMARFLTSEIQDRIDISAYFKEAVQEPEILSAKEKIIAMSPGIKSVEYVSREEALERFNQKHGDSGIFSKALEEIGDNPFLPSLNIVTNGDPVQYQEISNILQNSEFSSLIDKVDFSQKKDTIEKVYSITSSINRFSLVLAVLLVMVAVLVVYNTIKLAIENSKEEIRTMKIVGADDWFVRGPFIIQGAIYGLIAFVVCFVVSGVLAYLLSPYVAVLLPGFSLGQFFLENSLVLILIQLIFGTALGVISSFIVVRKYLDI